MRRDLCSTCPNSPGYLVCRIPSSLLLTGSSIFSTEIQLHHDLCEVYFKIGCSSKQDRLCITTRQYIKYGGWRTGHSSLDDTICSCSAQQAAHLGGRFVMTSRSESVCTILVWTAQVSSCTFKQSQVFSGGSLYFTYIDINYWLLLLLSPASGRYWVIVILAAYNVRSNTKGRAEYG